MTQAASQACVRAPRQPLNKVTLRTYHGCPYHLRRRNVQALVSKTGMMVGFAKTLQAECHRPWQHAYIGYKALKKQLALICALVEDRKSSDGPNRLLDLKLLFQRQLDSEISKMLGFYDTTTAELFRRMEHLHTERRPVVLDVLNQRSTPVPVKLCVLDKYTSDWREVAQRIAHLLDFVSLNMQGLRKIVKKQDKQVGLLKVDDSPELTGVLRIKHPHEDQQWTQASFLAPEKMEELAAFQQHVELQNAQLEVRQRLAQLHKTRSKLCPALTEEPEESSAAIVPFASPPADDPCGIRIPNNNTPLARRSGGLERLSSSTAAGALAASAQARLSHVGAFSPRETRSFDSGSHRGRLHRWASFGSGESDISDFEPVLRDIAHAESRAQRNAGLVKTFANTMTTAAGIFEAVPEDEKATATLQGLLLNLLSAFLYMCNYNLVIPTMEMFCEHLGTQSSVSGALIGCADVTAIVASLGYSVWTNYAFRKPLLFAALTCLVGNVLYTLAWDAKGRWGLVLIILGRLLTGAGAARALNRRYIADFVSKEHRTKASIGFVAAGAGGMAVGPLIAVPLTRVMDRWQEPVRWGHLSINAVTVGGWIMVLAWAAFLAIAGILFVEPLAIASRDEHLDEGSPRSACQQPLLPQTSEDDSSRCVAADEPEVPANGVQSGNGRPAAHDDAEREHRDSKADGDEPRMESDVVVHVEASGDAVRVHCAACGSEGVWDDAAHAAGGDALLPPSWKKGLRSVEGVVKSNFFLPTATCIALLFLLKLVQQGSISAVPVFATDFYGWSPGRVGLFMAVSSLIMLPLNFSVAAITTHVSDRLLTGAALAACFLGCAAMYCSGGHALSLQRYVTSFEVQLTFTNVLEGVSMSLLSKVIHPDLAKGTFNAGLLATQSGSLGRLVGNFSIAIFGGLANSTVGLANLMYVTFSAFVVLCIAIYIHAFRTLKA